MPIGAVLPGTYADTKPLGLPAGLFAAVGGRTVRAAGVPRLTGRDDAVELIPTGGAAALAAAKP